MFFSWYFAWVFLAKVSIFFRTAIWNAIFYSLPLHHSTRELVLLLELQCCLFCSCGLCKCMHVCDHFGILMIISTWEIPWESHWELPGDLLTNLEWLKFSMMKMMMNAWMLDELLRNFWWISYEYLMYFLCISYALFMHFLCTFYALYKSA